MIEFRTLGTLDLRADDGRELHSLLAQPKRIALLAYLCVAHPHGYHRRDTLLGLFWGDYDQEHARTSLRKSLHILRRAVGEEVIQSRGDEEVAVDAKRLSCDLTSFETAIREHRYQNALDLYRGELLTGFFIDDAPEFEQWLQSERRRIHDAVARASLAAAEDLERIGDFKAAVGFARRSLELSNNDEHTLRKLIGLQFKAGDRAAAMESYQAFARRMGAEYHAEPSVETRSLIEHVRATAQESARSQHSAPTEIDAEDAVIAASELRRDSVGVDLRENIGRVREKRWFAAAAIAVLLSAGFIWGLTRPAPSQQVLRYKLVVDSAEPLAQELPFAGRLALSPDGSRLAYMSGSRNGPDLPVLRIRPRDQLHAVTVPGTEEVNTPFFSPDGHSIGFLRQKSVWMSSLDGGPPVHVSDSLTGVAGASWGSDGYIYADGFESAPLARVEAKHGAVPKWFTTLDTTRGEGDHSWPYVLPNGKGVLFTVTLRNKETPQGHDEFAIAVAQIPSGKHRIIIEDGAYPVYATSGDVLYVNSKQTLMRVGFDQSTMTVTGEPKPLLEGMRLGAFGATDLAVSNTGTLVYAIGAGLSRYETELLWVGRDGNATAVDPDWHGIFHGPSISPDGKRLAIAKSPDGRRTDIWIKQLDHGSAAKVTPDLFADGQPIWSPDGKWLTYHASKPGDRSELWTQRVDGIGQPVRVFSKFQDAWGARWSPDGKWLVFQAAHQHTQADVDGFRPGVDTAPVSLVAGEFYDVAAEVSPDGHWLAYQSDETGLYQIYVVPFPNTKAEKQAVTTTGGIHVRWGRLGNELFYRDTSGDIYTVPVKTRPTFWSGTPKKLFTAKRAVFPLVGYAVAPDDRLLVVKLLHPDTTDRIVVVEHWFDELRNQGRKK